MNLRLPFATTGSPKPKYREVFEFNGAPETMKLRTGFWLFCGRQLTFVTKGNRRVANGEKTQRAAHLAMKRGPSVDFSRYWQRHVKAAQWCHAK
jgi:hypothetical protein